MRKPLANIDKADYNYFNSPAFSAILSGNMLPVKRAFLKEVCRNNAPVIICLNNTSNILPAGTRFDYSIHDNSNGFDVFGSMTVREACVYLQNVAYEKNYGDEQVVQIIRYLTLIDKFNSSLGLDLPTIRAINAHYYKPDVIGDALTTMFRNGEITREEYDRLNILMIRSIKGQLIIDNLLASIDFNLNYNGRNSGVFSPGFLKSGQTTVLDLSAQHGTYTEMRKRKDVLYSIESRSNDMVVLVDIGSADYSLAADFIRNMTGRNCKLIVIIDDFFAQCKDYDTVRRRFSYNIFGQHTGESCRKLCECFHEVYRLETHYARSVDSRIFADKFIDRLFHTNHTDTITTVPVRRSVIEQENIAELSDRAFILLDNTGSTDYFSIRSI